MSARDKANRVLIHVILILVSITMLVPFLWMILTAFKTMTEATSVNPFVILPSTWRWDSFKEVNHDTSESDLSGGRLCIWTSELQGEKSDVLSGSFPDDGSWTDLHYPTVLNGK